MQVQHGCWTETSGAATSDHPRNVVHSKPNELPPAAPSRPVNSGSRGSGSYRYSVLALRAYWRQRQMQARYAASHVQHMQKAMEQMNVKLTEAVSDITGLTGMSIIEAILNGERDPIKLAKLRDDRCHHSEDQIALALQGTWRPEHLFELRQAHALYQFHHQQITECDQQVQAELLNFQNRAGEKTRTAKPRKRGRKE